MAIWQDLVDRLRFQRRLSNRQALRAQAARSSAARSRRESSSPHPEKKRKSITAPARWCAIRRRGKYRRTRLFVMTLGYSRKSVRLLTFRSSSRIWAELHENSLSPAGRQSARRRARQSARRRADSRHLRSHAQSAYSRTCSLTTAWSAMPCRVQRSRSQRQSRVRRRSRAENTAERTTLRKLWKKPKPISITGNRAGPTRASTARPNGKSRPCLPKKNRPCCRCRSNRSATTSTANASCIWTAASKSKPPTTACRRAGSDELVKVQWDALHVRILDPKTHQLLREHVRQQRGGHRIKPEDNPKKTPLSTAQLLARAARAGSHIGAFCEAIHRHQGEAGIRRILGVLSLAKKFGVSAVEDACAAALELGVLRIPLRPPLSGAPSPADAPQVDPLIRELIQYRDLINLKIQEQEP